MRTIRNPTPPLSGKDQYGNRMSIMDIDYRGWEKLPPKKVKIDERFLSENRLSFSDAVEEMRPRQQPVTSFDDPNVKPARTE